MDTTIVFTPGQILALCSAIVLLSGAGNVLVNIITKATAPNKLQNQRLDDIEKRLAEHESYFKRDMDRFEDLETGNKVTQKAILALLQHALDGNDVEGVKKAKDELQDYLVDK